MSLYIIHKNIFHCGFFIFCNSTDKTILSVTMSGHVRYAYVCLYKYSLSEYIISELEDNSEPELIYLRLLQERSSEMCGVISGHLTEDYDLFTVCVVSIGHESASIRRTCKHSQCHRFVHRVITLSKSRVPSLFIHCKTYKVIPTRDVFNRCKFTHPPQTRGVKPMLG